MKKTLADLAGRSITWRHGMAGLFHFGDGFGVYFTPMTINKLGIREGDAATHVHVTFQSGTFPVKIARKEEGDRLIRFSAPDKGLQYHVYVDWGTNGSR